jgi:drug/metabolite transporter (DMT)-like permease
MNIYSVLTLQMLVASGTHIVAKAVTNSVDAVTLTFLRSVISTSGLVLITLARRRSLRVDRADLPKLLWIGILGLPINQFFYLYGLQFTTAANGALLYATTPVFVLLLSHYLLKERMTLRKSVGIGLAFTGVVIVIFERGIDLSSRYTFGNVVILVAVIAWALFSIQGKAMILKYGALLTTTIAMAFGTLVFLPFGLAAVASFPLASLGASQWYGIIYLGVGTSIVGYFLWYYALGRIEATKVAVFANGQPVVATVLALIFLDYSITGAFIVGGAVAMSGVVLTQRG